MICAGYEKFTMIKDATTGSGTRLQNPDRMLILIMDVIKGFFCLACKNKIKGVQNIFVILNERTRNQPSDKFLDNDQHDNQWLPLASHSVCTSMPFLGKVQPSHFLSIQSSQNKPAKLSQQIFTSTQKLTKLNMSVSTTSIQTIKLIKFKSNEK